MRRTFRIGAVMILLLGALPASAQVEVQSLATASSTDEVFDPFDLAEDYEEDTSDVPGVVARARASACLQPCVVIPPHEAEAEADASTDYGVNDVRVYSQSWSDGTNSSYHDAATASSRWQDELTLSSQDPGASGLLHATFRVQGTWQNFACFELVAFLYDPASETACTDLCCPCYAAAAFNGVSNQLEPECEALAPYGGTFFQPGFPDIGAEDGAIDLAVQVQLPIVLDVPLVLGASLGAATGMLDFSTLESGIEVTVESLEVPAGVAVDSAANALSSYHVVPEPGAGVAEASLVALVLVGLLRRAAVLV